MNTYSRALYYIDMNDVKQKHQQKLIEKKVQEEKLREEKKYIASVMKEKKYDWRKKLNEQMTTSDILFTTLPAVGNTDLANPQWNITAGTSYSSSGSSATITNTGSIGPGGVTNGFISRFDTSYYDTLVFDVEITGNSILADSSGVIATSSGTYSMTVPQAKSKSLEFLSPALSNGTVTISNLRFQRRTSLNVFIPLDSPDATSFVRTGSGDLSPEEKQKRLKEMLEASDEYVQQMYGDEFPGSGSAPPGEAGDTPGVEIAQIQPIEPAQQRRGATGVGVPDTTGTSPGSNPPPRSQMNYPKEWLPKQA
jgi:hypothetical protein